MSRPLHSLLWFPQSGHFFRSVSDDRQNGVVDPGCITFPNCIANSRVSGLTHNAVLASRFEDLIRDFPGDLEDHVKEKERDVPIKCWLRVGRKDEGEKIGEEGRPLVGVCAEEEECQCMREFIAQD
jgi:hypothetical protein